jgi:hypothetical protein
MQQGCQSVSANSHPLLTAKMNGPQCRRVFLVQKMIEVGFQASISPTRELGRLIALVSECYNSGEGDELQTIVTATVAMDNSNRPSGLLTASLC